MNFDASLFDNSVVTAVVLRNHYGVVLGAWINRFFSSNSFCAETEAAIQALTIAHEAGMDSMMFEGDSLQVVLALQGDIHQGDWRVKQQLNIGKHFLRTHVLWTVQHVNRQCNRCAHNVARWARNCNLSGKLDVTTLPPELLCDRGGTDVLFEADEPSAI